MKICSKCKVSKTEDNFFKCLRNKDGLQYMCKTCCACANKTTRKDKKYMIRHILKYPEKHRARQVIWNAVHRKRIIKPDNCSVCNIQLPKDRIEAHHEDYSKPLYVKWVCRMCHVAIHHK